MFDRKFLILLSACLLSMVLGSVHAFSVFLEPLEERFVASRSLVSLTYSLALVALTIAVLMGYRLFSRWSAGGFVSAICLLASIGALIAAFASSLTMVWLGYSLLFGAANGLGYGFSLQISAQTYPGRKGVSMGIVTACYALGAAVSPAMFTFAISLGGFRAAMLGLASALLVAAPICAGLMIKAGATFKAAPTQAAEDPLSSRKITLLWLGYGAGVAAGLMAIGHATGIAKALGFNGAPWVTPILIAVCNMFGSFAGGWLTDRVAPARLLVWLPLLSTTALLILVFQGNTVAVLLCLGSVGFAYGAIIAAYPATVSMIFGTLDSSRIYGRVFTAWGSAGLFAPWLAGFLFDWTGGYSLALSTAAALGVFSAFSIYLLFRGEYESAEADNSKWG